MNFDKKMFLKRIRARRQSLMASLRYTDDFDTNRRETLMYKIELLNCLIWEFKDRHYNTSWSIDRALKSRRNKQL